MVAIDGDPGQFNPGITTAGLTRTVAGNIFNGLVFLDDQFNPQPDLAESWTVSPDAKTYTFTLANGVTWHDGQPFTSADVKFSFEQILLKYHPGTKVGLQNLLDGIDAPDPSTVVMRLKQPYAPLLQRLGFTDAPILPQHVYEGTDVQTTPANQRPIGTGPFKLAEYHKGDSVRLVRNERYFKAGLPYLDELDFKIVPQAQTATIALERGEVDYLTSVAEPDVAHLRALPGVSVATTSAIASGAVNCQWLLLLNVTRSPLDKPEARQALADAIDRQQILDEVLFGQGKVATSPISSALAWAHDPNVAQYPHDLARANELDQAGLPRGADGVRFTLDFPHGPGPRFADVIAQDLSPVGIRINAQTLDGNAANEAIFVKHEADLGLWGSCNGADPDIGVPRPYVSTNVMPIVGANIGYANPRVDELFTQAAATSDRDQRASLYREVQDILVKDLPVLWLAEMQPVRAYRSDYHDLAIWSGNLAERAWTEKGQ